MPTDAIAATTRYSPIDANGRTLAGGTDLAMGSAVAMAWDPDLLTEAAATGLSADHALFVVLLVVYALLLVAAPGVGALHRLRLSTDS